MKSNALLAWCLNSIHPETKFKCNDESLRRDTLDYFQSFVENAANDDANIILTSEDFAYPGLDIAELTSYILPHEYKIHVVVYYRRLYDWLYSYYNQMTKRRNRPKITFVEWLTDEKLEDRLLGYSVAMYNRFVEAPGIFKVSVVNMHEDPDNFSTCERFACDHMDQAYHLCEAAKSNTIPNRNASVDIDWLIFRKRISYYHPIELSELDGRWEKIEVKFYEMTDIPKLCLSPEWKKKLFQTSLEAEIALTPESWYNSKEGLESLKSDYEEKVNTKLCSMDLETILISAEWQDFLTDLEEDEIAGGY